MPIIMRFFCVITMLFLFMVPSTYGQESEESLTQAVESPQAKMIGARHRALGWNVNSLDGDVGGVLINPTALSGIEFMQFSLGSQSMLGYFEYSTLQFAYPYMDYVFSFSYGSNMLSGIPRTDALLDSTGQSTTFYQVGTYSSGWRLFHFALSKDFYMKSLFFNKLSYGVGVKGLQQMLVQSRMSFGADVGLLTTSFMNGEWGLDEVRFGFSMVNAFATKLPEWEIYEGEEKGPAADVARQIFLSLSADLEAYDATVFTGLGGFLQDKDYPAMDNVSFGAEYKLTEQFDFRGALVYKLEEATQEFNLGVGMFIDKISLVNDQYGLRLDYNYTAASFPFEGSATHAINFSVLGKARATMPSLSYPKKDFVTKEKKITLKGKSEAGAKILVFHNDVRAREVVPKARGEFVVEDYPLLEGENEFYIRAQLGKKELSDPSRKVVVISDNTKPELSIDMNVSKDLRYLYIHTRLNEKIDRLEGTIEDKKISFSKSDDLHYSSRIPFPEQFKNGGYLPESMLTVTVNVWDKAGNKSDTAEEEFILAIDYPKDKTLINNHSYMIFGTVSPLIESIRVDGETVRIDKNMKFSHTISSGYGKHLIQLDAITKDGVSLTYYARVLGLKRFKDVKAGFPNKRNIELLATMGFIDGDKDGNFRADTVVSRRELMKQVVKILKLETPLSIKEDPFFDVDKKDPDAKYIVVGVEEGVMFSYPDGTFKPDNPVTIAEGFDILVNNDIIESDDTVVDTDPLTRRELAEMMKNVRQFNERVNYLLDWEKGYLDATD